MIKRGIIVVFGVLILFSGIFALNISAINTLSQTKEGDVLKLTSQSAVLMEPLTKTVIYEKNSHERLKPASVTKIMTLLLIYDAVEAGKIGWDDEVVISETASGMGGSQVYLETNEVQTVATLTKCIAVASANDGSVAMAEYIGGSEIGFVQMMNDKAEALGMVDTNFENASGLDSDNHYTSAYDIALMARELTVKYPEIFDISTIWMDTIIHNTKRGAEEFGLTNTNKLLQWYDGATGLKTGSTSLAKYCLAGTATRNDLDLIAVVMAAPDFKVRFKEVMSMFDYGFALCRKYKDNVVNQDMGSLKVRRGILEEIKVFAKEDFNYVMMDTKYDESKIKKQVILPEYIEAPVVKSQKVGDLIYTYDGKEIGRVDIVVLDDVNKAKFSDYLKNVFEKYVN
ncbi:MAG: D-alanyl-D-alanine carboxypeptidase [Firmicutes bacterium HGW-Firmicutes-1]|jgi:D-alanyl-D-alanine carboxypeptidase (penicillin-binding protein 5/6)|nr:MAG: D-alanyl-D-alanine carboxypeptidase [Firmicutes bacterium HGW-Firmicutes-1]